jgi:hypothetical protein
MTAKNALLGRCDMHCVRCLLTFWKTVLAPSSGSKNKSSSQDRVSAKSVLQLLAEEKKENCLSVAPGMLEVQKPMKTL